METRNKVEIIYCKECRWLMRYAWIAPEKSLGHTDM